jgi:hypothetical protein
VNKNPTAQQAALMSFREKQLNGVQKIIYLPIRMAQGAAGYFVNLGLF